MDFIRKQRGLSCDMITPVIWFNLLSTYINILFLASPSHNPDTHHCLNGADGNLWYFGQTLETYLTLIHLSV
jgi:hypothetical protein